MATISALLHHKMPHFFWTGFYRLIDGKLKVGPYQGGHGCLTIALDRGVCGKCAREKTVQNVPDVREVPYHIACSSDTRSEIVLPVLDSLGIDPIWYGVLLMINLELALITPPVGMNLFVIKGIAKAPMADVVRGIVPYVGLMLLGLLLMLLFPGLSTWLPATMGYGR